MSTSSDRIAHAVTRLRRESHTLEDLVRGLSDEQWRQPTPAVGWTIAHQIAHLHWTDLAALTSLREPERFEDYRHQAAKSPQYVDEAAEQGAQLEVSELFSRWQSSRDALAATLEQADTTARFPWFGPSMKALSMVTARIMETWAHGQDVANALGAPWPATEALKDIAHLGLATREFTYRNNNIEPPSTPMYVELTGPQHQVWTWGDPTAENSVKGSAWDFALLVTQRAELSELDLHITGEDAATWASIAQAFAGAPKAVVRARQARLADENSATH